MSYSILIGQFTIISHNIPISRWWKTISLLVTCEQAHLLRHQWKLRWHFCADLCAQSARIIEKTQIWMQNRKSPSLKFLYKSIVRANCRRRHHRYSRAVAAYASVASVAVIATAKRTQRNIWNRWRQKRKQQQVHICVRAERTGNANTSLRRYQMKFKGTTHSDSVCTHHKHFYRAPSIRLDIFKSLRMKGITKQISTHKTAIAQCVCVCQIRMYSSYANTCVSGTHHTHTQRDKLHAKTNAPKTCTHTYTHVYADRAGKRMRMRNNGLVKW